MSLWPWLLLLSTAEAADHPLVDAALSRIDQSYLYEGVPPDLLEEAAVLGIVALLNELQGVEANGVLTPEARALREDAVRGARRGFGFEYSLLAPHGFRITRVFPGSSADEAGLRSDDLVVALNGTNLSQLPPEGIRAEMRRAAPEPLQLTIVNRGERRVVTVVPRPYQVDPVWSEAKGEVPCLRVSHFSQDAARRLASELDDIPPSGLILDLRDNPGGLLEEARKAAELFLPKGAEAGSIRRRHADPVRLTMQRAPSYSGPVAIIVNQGTTAAAEWFVLALQKAHSGPVWVVGSATAGVDTGTTFLELPDGMSLELTTEAWSGPGDQGWSATGVVPDVLVPPAVVLPTDPYAPLPDPPLDTATRLVRDDGDASP